MAEMVRNIEELKQKQQAEAKLVRKNSLNKSSERRKSKSTTISTDI